MALNKAHIALQEAQPGRERSSTDVALLLARATRSGRPAGEAAGTHMAGVLQSTLLADEDQSLSLGEPQ